jgi:ADP-ribosylation factor-like protein 5B
LKNAVILIYANKQDLKGSLSAAEIAAALRLHAVTSHSWHIQACSALRGEGLSDGFEWLISKVMAPIQK